MNPGPESAFTACAETVIRFICGAEKSLQAAVCWLTHPEIFKCLLERIQAGVEVQIILNFDQFNFHAGGLNFNALINVNAAIYGYPGPNLLHHKFAIADHKRLLTGSFNWTRSEHFDHVVIWDCPQTCMAFTQAFEDLIPLCKPLFVLSNKPVRLVSFQQLHQPSLWSVQDLRKAIIAGGRVWVAPFNKKEIAVWQQCYTGQRHYFRTHPAMEQYWKRHGLWQAAAFREWLLRQEDQAGLQATARYCLKVKPGDILIAVEPQKRLLALGLISSDPESSPIPTYGVSRYVPWIKWPEEAIVPDPAILKPGRTLKRYAGSGLRIVEALSKRLSQEAPAL